jgi:RHS repeat-associated protein
VYGYDHASNLLSITPNGATQSFAYTSTNSITSGSYDSNGSPTVLSGNSYKWDGANRVVGFANSANNTGSSFTYDGLGRLVRVVDTHAGAVTADHSYTWCGNVRCLAHDNTQSGSPVSTQYFDQGAIIGGTSYYYVKDQLGSVTHLVTNAGSVASQYTYDPYGNQTTVSGTVVSDIGYAGYFTHAASGLDFAMYRAYDPVHARWLNRDPIGEAGGTNLYGYVGGNPVSDTDPLGWCPDKQECMQKFLRDYYGDFVANTLVPEFSPISFVTNFSEFVKGSELSFAAKGLVYGLPALAGKLATITGNNLTQYPGTAAAAADALETGAFWTTTATTLSYLLAVPISGAGGFALGADAMARWECRNVE